MAPFCQLPVNLISCNSLRTSDVQAQLGVGVLVGVVGGALVLWWAFASRPRCRWEALLPLSTTFYLVATTLDSAGRLLHSSSLGSFTHLDRTAGGFSALSLLAYLSYLLATLVNPLISPSSPHLFLRPLRPLLLFLLPLLSLIAAVLSIVSQTTVSYGGNDEVVQAGFLTTGAVEQYSGFIKGEVSLVLALQSVAMLAVLWTAWFRAKGGEADRGVVLGLQGGGLALGIARVALVFVLPTPGLLLLKRMFLFAEYSAFCLAAVLRSRIREDDHRSLSDDNEPTMLEIPYSASLHWAPPLSSLFSTTPSFRTPISGAPFTNPSYPVPTQSATNPLATPYANPFATPSSRANLLSSAIARARERAALRTNGVVQPLSVDLAAPQSRMSWSSTTRPVAYAASHSSLEASEESREPSEGTHRFEGTPRLDVPRSLEAEAFPVSARSSFQSLTPDSASTLGSVVLGRAYSISTSKGTLSHRLSPPRPTFPSSAHTSISQLEVGPGDQQRRSEDFPISPFHDRYGEGQLTTPPASRTRSKGGLGRSGTGRTDRSSVDQGPFALDG